MAAIWILTIFFQLLLVIKYSIALPSCSENVTKLQVCAISPDFKGDFFCFTIEKKFEINFLSDARGPFSILAGLYFRQLANLKCKFQLFLKGRAKINHV